MLPLSSYSTFFVQADPSTEFKNDVAITEFDEDDKERYIRKVFHKIRNARKEKRTIDVAMSIYVYSAYNFNLNGYTLKRVILQMKIYSYSDIDVSSYKDVDAYNPIIGLSSTGIQFDDKLTFYFDNEDDKQTVINYINGNDSDDFIPAFSHFDEKMIDIEIAQRQNNPGLINQSSTPLCGSAIVGNLIAKHYKTDFKYLVKDLFFYAEAFFGTTNYLIKPRNSITGQNYHINPNDGFYPSGMPQSDYVLLTSIKNSENKVFSYDGLGGVGGIALPSDITSLLLKMLKSKEVIDITSFLGTGLDEMQLLSDMDTDYSGGYECIMLIDSNLLSDDITESGLRPNHWINYRGGLSIDTINSKITFKLFTWGQGDGKQYTVKQAVFEKHFYGYIKAKIV
jgi:hypothetical protein